MDRQNVTLEKKHTFMLQRITWYRNRGCKRTPKNFDLSKIRAKSLKSWAKMAANVVWFQQMAPNISRKHMKTFFGCHTKKRYSWSVIFVEKFCRECPTKLFGQVWENSVKNLLHPQKFASPKPMYIYRFSNQIWMVFRHKRNRKPFWL